MDLGVIVASLVGAVFGGGGTAAVVTAITRRRLTRVEAADRLADTAMDLLNTVRKDTREELVAMRAEVAENRKEAAELRVALRNATSQAEILSAYLSRITSAIQDPSMTMDRLKVMFGAGPPSGMSLWVHE